MRRNLKGGKHGLELINLIVSKLKDEIFFSIKFKHTLEFLVDFSFMDFTSNNNFNPVYSA